MATPRFGDGSGRTTRRNLLVAAAASLLAVGSGPVAAGHAAAGNAFVRVNQVGYPAAGAKRAFLMSGPAQSGTFTVRNASGAAVLTGGVGADLGSWSTSYPHVYALDFDA